MSNFIIKKGEKVLFSEEYMLLTDKYACINYFIDTPPNKRQELNILKLDKIKHLTYEKVIKHDDLIEDLPVYAIFPFKGSEGIILQYNGEWDLTGIYYHNKKGKVFNRHMIVDKVDKSGVVDLTIEEVPTLVFDLLQEQVDEINDKSINTNIYKKIGNIDYLRTPQLEFNYLTHTSFRYLIGGNTLDKDDEFSATVTTKQDRLPNAGFVPISLNMEEFTGLDEQEKLEKIEQLMLF